MGTKVQCKSYLPGYYPMRDLNEDSNSGSWSIYYGDKTLPNAQYYNGFSPRTVSGVYTVHSKDVVKQIMLEHDAIFRNQVYELHRLYRIQRDLMDEVKRKELHKHQGPVEPLLSSNPVVSQIPNEGSQRWQFPNFSGPYVSNADNIPSPMKDKSAQADPIASQSGPCLKNCEELGSRPSKVRRTFDLQLPADEYIDTEEVDLNCKIASKSSAKLFIGNSEKHDNASTSNSCLRRKKDLADLNEPIQVEETSDVASIEFQNHKITAKPMSRLLGVSKEILQKSHLESSCGTLNNQLRDSKAKGKEWLPYMLEAGHNQSNPKSIPRGLQQELLNLPSQSPGMINRTCELPTLHPNDQSSGDLRRERTIFGLEISTRSHDLSSYNHPVPPSASQLNGSFSFVPPSDLVNSWSHSVCSSEKPSISLNQKLMTPQTCLNSSVNSNNSKFDLNTAFRSILPNRNGFYHGSSSGSKEEPASYPSIGFDYMNCKNYGIAFEQLMSRSSSNHINGSNCVMLSSSSSNGAVPEKGLKVFNYDLNSETGKGSCQNLAPNFASASSVCDDKAKRIEKGDSARKILGVPIFDEPYVSKNESFSCTSPSVSYKNSKSMEIPDINLGSDPPVPDLVLEKGSDSKVANFRGLIDLNSCISEDEASLAPAVPVCWAKTTTGIDLEAPLVLETNEDIHPGEDSQVKNHKKPEDPLGELAKVAAEAIVSISSSTDQIQLEDTGCNVEEASLTETLNWFVGIAFSCWDDLRTKNGGQPKEPSYRRMDYFEFMTLKLKESEVEECLCNPQNLDSSKVEETAPALLANRPRKGQGRRGRQRRDFQRDILPGLASLSRHEVTEDLQTLGGMMKAMGHSWQSGPTRRNATRNGSTRGRPRSLATPTPPVIQLSTDTEMGLTERSLTGWGKTTRRPRRQRCPLGNSPSLPLA